MQVIICAGCDIIGHMKNWHEYLIVVILGIVVSLIVTVVMFWRSDGNQIIIPTPPPRPATPPPVTQLPDMRSRAIQLTAPADEAVFDNKALTITGEATPGSQVVVFVNQKNFVIKADDKGDFTLDVNLESGSNEIVAAVIDEQGDTFWDRRLVVYTNKSLEEILLTDEELQDEIAANQDKSDETNNN